MPHGHPAADSARGIESAVFREFFGNMPDQLQEAYSPYETASCWLLVVDRHKRRAAGCLRFIKPGPASLKTLVDASKPPLSLPTARVITEHGIDLGRCWDIGTLAVMPEYRGDHLVASELYGQFYAACRRAHVKHAVTVLDDHAYRQLVDVLGLPFERLCGSEPVSYLGSAKSHAVVIHGAKIPAAVEKRLAELEPGLRSVVSPTAQRVARGDGLVVPIFVKR